VVGFARWLATQPGVVGLWPAQAVANRALCGVGAIDGSTAMTMMPLYDGLGWSEAVCGQIGITPTMLPIVSPGFAPIGATPEGARVSGGTIDAQAEQLVADARAPGDVLVICGTTLIIWALSESRQQAPGLWSVPYTVPGLYAIGGASNAGGLFIDRVRILVGDTEGEAGSTDVPVWLPYLRGERTPLHDPDRRAELLDVHLGHGPAEVVRAAHEASGFVVRHHLERAGFDARRLVAVGGGTRSAAWMQALADAAGVVVDVAVHPEGAAIGAARIARATAGLDSDLSGAGAWAGVERRVEPRPEWVAACGARYRRFLDATNR
jgi:xylulokinase